MQINIGIFNIKILNWCICHEQEKRIGCEIVKIILKNKIKYNSTISEKVFNIVISTLGVMEGEMWFIKM